MSDDFTPDAADHDPISDETAARQIHDRLNALGRQWRDRRVPTGRLSAHLRSLAASDHLGATSGNYPLQEEFVLMNTHVTHPPRVLAPRRYLISTISAALVVALLAVAFFVVIRKGIGTYTLTPTATAPRVTATSLAPTTTTQSAAIHGINWLHMIDANAGWAQAAQKVLRTTDGGRHWQDVTPPGVTFSPTGLQRFVITALNASTAWATNGKTIYRTTDGGQTWESASPPVQAHIGYLTFVDALHGWAGDDLGATTSSTGMNILRTTDGGASWTQVATTNGSGNLPLGGDKSWPTFIDDMTGWIGDGGPADNAIYLYVTHDGGVTWRQQSLPRPTSQNFQAGISNITFFDANDGALSMRIFITTPPGGPGGLYNYVTHDGGASWSIAGAPQGINTPDYLDANHWWALTYQLGLPLHVTSDGGQHWTTINPGGAFVNVDLLDFVSATTGWAYSTGSLVLLQTTDGGKTWKQINFQIG